MIRIAIDAGHGGSDPGAVYMDRYEKDDNLRIALLVGQILERNEIHVVYTRTVDIYETPTRKAEEANVSKTDYFVSFHRNSSEIPNSFSGVESLVYNSYGKGYELANNINQRLVEIGFENLGITERKNLIVLRKTSMPAVLLEIGYINSDSDNQFFDENIDLIADAIAQGILETVL